MNRRVIAACVFLLFASATVADAQVPVVNGRRVPGGRRPQFRIQQVEVNATIKDQAATVQMAQVFENQSSFTIETQFVFPLPEGVAISGLTLVVDGKEMTGELRKKEDARRIYENIVRQQKDPALLEYIGDNVFKTSVFPIPARQKRRVEIRYTQLLKKDTGLVDFSLPLGTYKHTQQPIEKMKLNVRIDTVEPIKTLYSPTHEFEIERPDEDMARCKLVLNNVTRPSDVRLLYGTKGGDVGMNLISYRPDAEKDGYFLLLASPRVKSKKNETIAKTVLFVVDRSGSMSGEKIDQAKASLKYMINQLGDRDTFNIVSYSSEVELFREELEVVNSDTRQAAQGFVEDIYAGGGTNINDALTAALQQLKDRSRPCYVMFMTDGLPTVGVKSEKTIAANAKRLNEFSSRIFSFGVGYDVNSRLLDRLSRDNRGSSVYVKPNEDIEVASTNLFRKVSSPVLTDLDVDIVPESHDSERKAVKRVYPRDVTDLFRGEQLVMVGRYNASGKTRVKITGRIGDKKKKFELQTKLVKKSETGANGYVEKLWATRRIGEIIDELDLNGNNKELVDELVALSLKHGIMTPYTSFLADENTQLANRDQFGRARERLRLGLRSASGQAAFNQRSLKQDLLESKVAAPVDSSGGMVGASDKASQGRGRGGASFGGGGGGEKSKRSQSQQGARPSRYSLKELDAEAKEEAEGKDASRERVRRIGTKTFYWKKDQWLDADLSDAKYKEAKVIEVEQFTDAYFKLAAKDKGKYSDFLSLKEPVELLLDGKRYRVVPARKNAAEDKGKKEKSAEEKKTDKKSDDKKKDDVSEKK